MSPSAALHSPRRVIANRQTFDTLLIKVSLLGSVKKVTSLVQCRHFLTSSSRTSSCCSCPDLCCAKSLSRAISWGLDLGWKAASPLGRRGHRKLYCEVSISDRLYSCPSRFHPTIVGNISSNIAYIVFDIEARWLYQSREKRQERVLFSEICGSR